MTLVYSLFHYRISLRSEHLGRLFRRRIGHCSLASSVFSSSDQNGVSTRVGSIRRITLGYFVPFLSFPFRLLSMVIWFTLGIFPSSPLVLQEGESVGNRSNPEVQFLVQLGSIIF